MIDIECLAVSRYWGLLLSYFWSHLEIDIVHD